MTIDEIELAIMAAHRCTPEQYAIVKGRPWNGRDRFIWLQRNLDVGYPIRPHTSGGGKPNPTSERQRQPWLEQGISERTYYARKATEARWCAIFMELNAIDTPANRTAYTSLHKTAKVLGVPFEQLWGKYIETVCLPPGESAVVVAEVQQQQPITSPPLTPSADASEVQQHDCPAKGPCLVCHTWKV